MKSQVKSQTSFYGWKLVAVFWFVLLADLQFPYVVGSIANAYMAWDLHLSRTTVGLAYAVFTWMSGLPGPLVAFIVDKRGVRFTLLLGSLFLLVGSIWMAQFVHTGSEAIVAFGVVVGLGVITGGQFAPMAGINRWFVKRRARAIALIQTAPCIGGFIAPPVLIYIIESAHGNWRMAWWLMALLAAIGALLIALFVIESPADIGQVPDGGAGAADLLAEAASNRRSGVFQTTQDWSVAEALRTPALWWILVSFIGYDGGFFLFSAQGVMLLRDLGRSPGGVAVSLSLVALFATCGTLFVAAVGDHIEPRLIIAFSMVASGIGLVMVLKASSTTNLYLYPVFLGLSMGIGGTVVFALLANYYGNRPYAHVMGIKWIFTTTSGAIASYGGGYAFDHFGTYAPAFYACAILSILGFVILLFVRPPVRKDTEPLVTANAGR